MTGLFLRVDLRRQELKLSQSALCKQAGIFDSTYIDFKRGATPRAETLERIAKALGLSLTYVTEGKGPRLIEEFNRMLAKWEERHA